MVKKCVALGIWLAFTAAAQVHAQTSATNTSQTPAQISEEGLRRQEDRARELQQQVQPKADVLQPKAPLSVSTVLPIEIPCFPVKDIQLIGPDALRFHWLTVVAQPYLNQCAGVKGLRQIASAMDGELIRLGYATSRVTLPQQNLQGGTLTFQLHVGRIAQVSMHQADQAKSPDDAWGTWRNAFPIGRGDILNVRDLEQGVEQMKRVPSQMVATELEPGAEPDTSNVRILRRAESFANRIRGGLTLDNSGSRSLGAAQFSGHVSFDNPLGLNDIASLSTSSNLRRLDTDHRSQSLSLSYSVPWDYNTFTVSKSYSRFAQTVQGTTVRFLSSGRSDGAELRWHRTMLRTSAAKFGLYGAVSNRRAASFLDDVELIVQRRRTTGLETGITFKYLIGEASVDFDLGYRSGKPWQGAQDDFPDGTAGGLTLRPDITVLSAAYSQPFKLGALPIHYTSSLHAQVTRDLTLSIDQIAIGNRFSVRGFDGDSVLLAENGYFVRNEWSTPLRIIDGVDSIAFLGLDFGRVWGPSAALLVGDKLAGAAVGARGKWRGLQFDLAVATPLYKPDGFKTRHWNPYLSLTWAF